MLHGRKAVVRDHKEDRAVPAARLREAQAVDRRGVVLCAGFTGEKSVGSAWTNRNTSILKIRGVCDGLSATAAKSCRVA